MGCFNNKILMMLVIFYVTASSINSAPFPYENGTDADDLNGEKLMEIGKKLKLDWSVWSVCLARFGQIGSKVRTRRCSVNMTTCEIDSNSREEKEFGICIGFCPYGYKLTKNKFCMKLYSDNKVTKDTTEQQCQKDGGHLVNIDSELKSDDVSGLLTDFSYKGIWIDGHRKDNSSSWEYTYGSQKGFFKWYPREPGNNSHDLCLKIVLYSHGVKWHDSPCTQLYYSICEISEI